jgi:hypothetical protein
MIMGGLVQTQGSGETGEWSGTKEKQDCFLLGASADFRITNHYSKF